jgi:PPP family 3-phenylpropionic acid transporter
MAALIPFLTLYYRESGLTGAQIGLLVGVAPLVTWFAAPVWGAVADATQRYRTILATTILGSMVAVFFLGRVSGTAQLLPIVALYAFFTAPIMPLVDNSVMSMLGDRTDLYGRQRIWGAVGWGLAGAAAGALVERTGLGMAFYLFVLLMGLGLVVSLRLDVRSGALRQPFWRGIQGLIRTPPLVIFLVAVLITSMGSSVINSYLFLLMADLGASKQLMGLSLTFATLSELPVFFFSGWLLRRLGARGLLLLAMGAYVVRLAAYTVMPEVWWVLPINLLHGLTFAGLWVAGVSYANAVAPKGLGATAQGIFTGVTMGIGAATGALVGGALYDSVGPAALFRAAAIWVALGLLFFWAAGRLPRFALARST